MAAFLQIRVRRSHVVEDALNQLAHLEAQDLKKPLRVTFITGGVPEPAQVWRRGTRDEAAGTLHLPNALAACRLAVASSPCRRPPACLPACLAPLLCLPASVRACRTRAG